MNRYYVNRKFRLKRIRRIYDDMSPFERNQWRRRLDKHWKFWANPMDYSRSPSWWNRLHSTKPSRRTSNQLLHTIYIDIEYDHFNSNSFLSNSKYNLYL